MSAIKSVFVVLLVAIHTCLTAQDQANNENSVETAGLPYEVIVTPMVTRSDLRRLIVEVEDDLFARFNELNLDDRYDVFCYEITPTGSHIPKRICDPIFMYKARGQHTSESAQPLMNPYNMSWSFYLDDHGMKIEESPSFETLQEKMEEFAQSDFEFRSIASALSELKSKLKNFSVSDN